MNDVALRAALMSLLRDGGAHLTLDEALSGLEPTLRATRPPGLHSVWELVEHMRITQQDLLRYTTDPGWASPPWPEGYWPDDSDVTEAMLETVWEETVRKFEEDLAEVVALTESDRDLTAPLPHLKPEHTPLRQILLIADHNAYHLGQIVCTRRALRDWST